MSTRSFPIQLWGQPLFKLLKKHIFYAKWLRMLLLPGYPLVTWWMFTQGAENQITIKNLLLIVIMLVISWWWIATILDNSKYRWHLAWGKKRRIIRACQNGDLARVQQLIGKQTLVRGGRGVTCLSFEQQGKYAVELHCYLSLTPLREAINHHHWDLAKWLLIEQKLLFSPEFLGCTNQLVNDSGSLFWQQCVTKEQKEALTALALDLNPISYMGRPRWLVNAPLKLLKPGYDDSWELFLSQAPVELVSEMVRAALQEIQLSLHPLFVAVTLVKYEQLGIAPVDKLSELILASIEPESVATVFQHFVDKLEVGDKLKDLWLRLKVILQKQGLNQVLNLPRVMPSKIGQLRL